MEATFASAVTASGIVALAYALGCRAIARFDELAAAPIVRACVAFVIGAAVLTPVLVLIAAIGWLRWSLLGVVAWVVTLAAAMRTPRVPPGRRHPTAADIAVLGAAVVFAWVAIHTRDETLGAGRDQQVYAEFAVALARQGAPQVTYSPIDAADRRLLRSGYSRAACRARFVDRWAVARQSSTPFVVPGGTNACNGVDDPIKLLHPWGAPIWMSVADRIFGIEGVFAANAVVFALAALVFFALAKRFVDPLLAAVSTAILLSLPSSLWIAGISLSEPLAMAFMLAVAVLVTAKHRANDWLVAAVTLGAILVRIDAAVLVPVTIAVAIVSAANHPSSIARFRRFAWWQLGALSAGAGFYILVFPSYLDAFWAPFLALVALSAALLLALLVLTPTAARRLDAILCSVALRSALLGIVFLLFVYAAIVRPALPPASDDRELSLPNLAAYLSWPILLAALGGIGFALWRGWANRRRMRFPLALFLFLGASVELLAFPGVSSDQPWAFRRFVPVVVPGAVLFAVLFVHSLRRHPSRWISRWAFCAVSATIIASVIALPRGSAMLRENDGYRRQLDSIARALPSELTVASGALRAIASALLVAYDKPVAASNGELSSSEGDRALSAWIEQRIAAASPPYLLHGGELRETGLALSTLHSWTLRRQFIVPQPRAPATAIGTETRVVTLSRVDGFDPTFATRMFGFEQAWGSHEGGFRAPEVAGFGMFRYTDGHAWIDVPADSLRDRNALKVDLYSYSRGSIDREVAVTLDDRIAWKGSVPAGISTLRVPIGSPPRGETVHIGIESELLDAGDAAAADPRFGPGIGVIGIRALRAGEPRKSGPSMEEFRGAIGAVGPIPDPIVISSGVGTMLTLDVRNVGTAYWPSYRDHPDPRGVVKLALQWYDQATPQTPRSDGRWPLSISLLPGDRTRVRVPMAPEATGGKPLSPGVYELRVGMVREGFALFRGSALSLNVRVVRPEVRARRAPPPV